MIRDEAGQAGGLEGIAFGLLIFVLGTLLIANAWAVVDTKLAVTAAAREAARAFVEADDAPALHLEIDEERETVQRVLKHLPPDYRAVLVLRHFQQLAYEEMCQVLGLTMSQVKTRLFRARKMFKDRFQAFGGDGYAVS